MGTNDVDILIEKLMKSQSKAIPRNLMQNNNDKFLRSLEEQDLTSTMLKRKYDDAVEYQHVLEIMEDDADRGYDMMEDLKKRKKKQKKEEEEARARMAKESRDLEDDRTETSSISSSSNITSRSSKKLTNSKGSKAST